MEIVFSLCIQQNEVPGQNTSIWELTTDSYLLVSEKTEGGARHTSAVQRPVLVC